jgi:hypothetical protein
MTTVLTQSRKRSALATGTPMLSYSHAQPASQRTDMIEFVMQADTATPGGKGTYFTLAMPVGEFARVNRFVRDRQPAHNYKPTDDAKFMAEREVDLDAERGLSVQEQLAKALDFAVTMLKANMPHDEQDANTTLAYCQAVTDANPHKVL